MTEPVDLRPADREPAGNIAFFARRDRSMPLFWKHYKSDITAFIEQLKAQRPTLEDEQRAGRALLWDKRIDREAQSEHQESRVPQQPYVYQPKTP